MDYWKEVPFYSTIYHFKWQPFSNGIRFEQLSYCQRQMLNHFEFHAEITTKDCLFKNLLAYSQLNKLNVFDYVPLTFVLDLDSQTYNPDFERFVQCYNVLDSFTKVENIDEPTLKLMNTKLQNITFSKDRRAVTHCKAKISATHFAGRNIWILKPTGFNRGRGVTVFDSMEKLKALIKEYSEGVNETEPDETPVITNENPENCISNLNNLPNIVKSKTFVIQKYIERPLLIRERKFDVRVWVLVNQDMKVFFFKEGYIRTSSYPYSISSEAISQKNVHLTNNAVQKNCGNYGMFEDGNQMSFDQFQVIIIY